MEAVTLALVFMAGGAWLVHVISRVRRRDKELTLELGRLRGSLTEDEAAAHELATSLAQFREALSEVEKLIPAIAEAHSGAESGAQPNASHLGTRPAEVVTRQGASATPTALMKWAEKALPRNELFAAAFAARFNVLNEALYKSARQSLSINEQLQSLMRWPTLLDVQTALHAGHWTGIVDFQTASYTTSTQRSASILADFEEEVGRSVLVRAEAYETILASVAKTVPAEDVSRLMTGILDTALWLSASGVHQPHSESTAQRQRTHSHKTSKVYSRSSLHVGFREKRIRRYRKLLPAA